MGPRFVNVEYLAVKVGANQSRKVSMGPRFVNVEYLNGFLSFANFILCFNGATFCERGIPVNEVKACSLTALFQWGHVL